jgi:hypothetical protein
MNRTIEPEGWEESCQSEAFSRRATGIPIDVMLIAQLSRIPNQPGNVMANGEHTSGLKVGGLAFLAGVLATLVTAYAVVSRRRNPIGVVRPEYGGYDGEIGT